MRTSCPKCGSSRHRKTNSEASFQVLASRRCRDCGHVWEPPAPRWLLWVGLGIGTIWIALGAFMIGQGALGGGGPIEFRYLWISVVGVMAVTECGRRLRNGEYRTEPANPGSWDGSESGQDHPDEWA